MISVALNQGDMELSAAGTVTHIENDRLYAFGHRFISSGPTEMPLLGSSVITTVPNLNSSFKIAACKLSSLEHQHLVAGRERIDQRRLPGPRTRGRKDKDMPFGLENRLNAL